MNLILMIVIVITKYPALVVKQSAIVCVNKTWQ